MSSTVSTPLPEGINEPVNEKLKTVLLPVDVVNPASAAAPPPAPVIETPVTRNWKP
jgi:hypothetical protein